MNHFDPDESNDWKDDIDSFEQQLRSLRPTPAAQSADSIAQSIESPLDQPAVVTTGNPGIIILATDRQSFADSCHRSGGRCRCDVSPPVE